MKVGKFGGQPIICKIQKIKNECDDTKVFYLETPFRIEHVIPGQFVMLWVPGVDEYPLGVAGYKENILELGVAIVGEGTEALFAMKEGDKVGIRGFFGKGFTPTKNVARLIIGGGFGMPPLKFLLCDLLKRNEKEPIHVFQGARTKSKLMYIDLMEKLHDDNIIVFHGCTDDGSYGYKGFPTLDVKKFLKDYDEPVELYVAGPEKMMKAIFDLGKKYSQIVDMQMSLADRHMRCAYGVCGACVVDPTGYRICIDGPVFNTKQLEKITDFGKYARKASGEKEPI